MKKPLPDIDHVRSILYTGDDGAVRWLVERGCNARAHSVAGRPAKSTGNQFMTTSMSAEQIADLMPHHTCNDGEYLPTRFTAGQLRDVLHQALAAITLAAANAEAEATIIKWQVKFNDAESAGTFAILQRDRQTERAEQAERALVEAQKESKRLRNDLQHQAKQHCEAKAALHAELHEQLSNQGRIIAVLRAPVADVEKHVFFAYAEGAAGVADGEKEPVVPADIARRLLADRDKRIAELERMHPIGDSLGNYILDSHNGINRL